MSGEAVSSEDSDQGGDDDALVVTEDEVPAPTASPVGPEPVVATRPRAKLIAFASGRGGTGRSLLAANVAVYLAQAGKKVVALDADPAGGPLHQLLGANRPARGFGELMRGKVTGLSELIADTPIAGVGLIAGDGSAFGAARPRLTAKVTLAAIAALDVDYVVLDLGPPDSTLTLDLWLAADTSILVTIPIPLDRGDLPLREERVHPPPAHHARRRSPGPEPRRPTAWRAGRLPFDQGDGRPG